MKHNVKINVEEEKKGLFAKKKVLKTKTITSDHKTYKKLQKKKKKRLFSLSEMMLYDEIFDDD